MKIAESLRTLENLTRPDPRRKDVSIEYLHSKLDELKLNESVPEDLAIQFETAKNLFLYSWFVHRFHHIADLQAVATLELSLKTKFDELQIKYNPRAGLSNHLEKAANHGLLTAEDIPGYFELAKYRAKERHFHKNIQKMIDENLKELEFDESKVIPESEDYDPNYLKDTLYNLKEIRNIFAHGTTALFFPNFHILDLIRALINALYKEEA